MYFELQLTGVAQLVDPNSGMLSNIPVCNMAKSIQASTQWRGLPPQSGMIQCLEARIASSIPFRHFIDYIKQIS